MGADLVVAVDVGFDVGNYQINHIFDVLSRSLDIMSQEINRARIGDADLVIAPDVRDIGPFDFHRAEEAIGRGETAARQALPLLAKLMKEGCPDGN